MATSTCETIAREEFDRRLDKSNGRRRKELQQSEADQAQVEQLLTHYESALDEMEAELRSEDEPLSYPVMVRIQIVEKQARSRRH